MNVNVNELAAYTLYMLRVLEEAFRFFHPSFVLLLLFLCRQSPFFSKSLVILLSNSDCQALILFASLASIILFSIYYFIVSLYVSLFLFLKKSRMSLTKGRIQEGRRNILFKMKERLMTSLQTTISKQKP